MNVNNYTCFISEADCTSEEREEMEYEVDQAVQNIHAWKAHLIRSINQDSAKQNVLKTLDKHSVLLVSDWAMKFVPRKYRESQRDWFGKRGISWHLSVAIRKSPENGLEMLTFTHIFESCTQDSPTVLAIFDDVLQQLKRTIPSLQFVYMKQDNAGCYHSAPTMLGIHQIAKNNGINLARIDFSDPQGGKGACDRKAATIKNHMRAFLHSGNDIETAQDMKTAIESNGGVAGVAVTLCGKQMAQNFKASKWDGVSYINNIKYNDNGMRIWKAYEVGSGKVLNWKDVVLPSGIPKLNKKPNDCSKQYSFIAVKARVTSKQKENPQASACITAKDCQTQVYSPSTNHESDGDDDEEVGNDDDQVHGSSEIIDQRLFHCPEEGCIKSYQRHFSLQKHLDVGKHEYRLEQQTLFDRSMVLYASKLEQGSSEIVGSDNQITLSSLQHGNDAESEILAMGWALKTSGKKKRFTESQKHYLIDIFKNGEITGQKADSRTVSKSMRKAKTLDGSRMFKKEDFLTAQQISNFFSRLAKAKNLDTFVGTPELTSEEYDSPVMDKDIQELSSDVMDAIGLKHPIIYDIYNICEMASQNKLKKFSIAMLTEICSSLDLDTTHIKKKLKEPYIKLLQDIVQSCGCSV